MEAWKDNHYRLVDMWFKHFNGKAAAFTLYQEIQSGQRYLVDARIQEDGQTTILMDYMAVLEPDDIRVTEFGVGTDVSLSLIHILSILKSDNGNPDSCLRFTYAYQSPAAGEGRFIHTYMHDGNPLPSFEGEPKKVGISGDIDAFTDLVWNSLNEDNKVSLFVRFIDIAAGTYETRIVNKNK